MRPLLSLLTAALALACARPAAAALPDWQKQMNYQGQLTDASRVAVPDGSYSLSFKLYNDPSSVAAGNLVWSGETQSVNISKGLFNVYLGQLNPLPALSPLQLASDLYLFVQVAGEAAEMLPRQKLLPAFFARNALSLQGLYPNNTANNLVVLDGGGKLPAGAVGAPLDVAGAAGAYAIYGNNLSVGGAGLRGGGATGLQSSGSGTGVLVDPLTACCGGSVLLYNAPYPATASNGVNVTNECGACFAGIFNNLTATGGAAGAALRVTGRISAPDIVNTFVASAGVTSQVVSCTYCKAGDEIFLQVKGNIGSNTRYWVTSVSNGSFTLGYSSGLGSAISMAYLLVGDF